MDIAESAPAKNETIWAWAAASSQSVWTWISVAYLIYWCCFTAGAMLKVKELNSIGGMIVLAVLTMMAVERLWVRMDGVAIAALASMAGIPALQLLIGDPVSSDFLFKHVSFFLVIVVARLLLLPAVSQAKVRGFMAAQVLVILLISLTIFKGTSWDGGTRHSGLFLNPNNLALIPFLLLLFIDRKRDGWMLQLAAHAMVIIIMVYTATSGAVMAYLVGLWIYFSQSIPKSMRSTTYCAIAVVAVLGMAFFFFGGERLLPQSRMINQISVMSTDLQAVIDGKEIDYYAREKVLGSGTGSGIWRMMHWRRTIVYFAQADWIRQLFGIGIGSSPKILGLLPHNDFLRILFEQGYLGMGLFLFIGWRLIRDASPDIRYIGIVTAIYCFSENNLDNFPFMSLLALCLSANRRAEIVKQKVTLPKLPNIAYKDALAS